ncbi:MAG: MbnP family protein [Bacteroidia bacterium]
MKTTYFFAFILSITLLTSCSKETPTTVNSVATSNLTITFNNTVNGKTITSTDTNYRNAANNLYTIGLIKYYVTNIVLVDENSNEWFAKNYNLIDVFETAQNTFILNNIPNAKYTKLKFMIGVDSLRNSTGVQDGYLDPSHGMIWDWNTGYIFFKHEGNYINTANEVKPLRLHLGQNISRGNVEVDLPMLNVNGITSKLLIDFDLNKVYSAQNIIDFNIDNDRQSTEAVDTFWMQNMRKNLEKSFIFGKAE